MSQEAAQLAIASAAISGDAGALYRILTGLMDEGVPFDSLLFDYLLPTEASFGTRWAQGDYLISEEHAATATIETVIALLVGMFDQPDDGVRVVVAAAEGDDHSLPGRAISAHLLFLGYPVSFLGANVQADDLGKYLADESPDVLVLSCAMTTHLVGAHASIVAARAASVPVVAGGQGFGADSSRAMALGAAAWAGSIAEVVDLVDRVSGGSNPGTYPIPVPPAVAELNRLRPVVAAEAYQSIVEEAGPDSRSRWMGEIEILLGSLEGALLVDDPSVVRDMVSWQRATLEAQGLQNGLVDRALVASLESSVPAAADMLASASADG